MYEFGYDQIAAELRRLHADVEQLRSRLADGEPAYGQCRFAGEKEWRNCTAEHVRMALADPRYAAEGYEVRYLYAHPAAAPSPLSDEQVLQIAAVAHDCCDAIRRAERKLGIGDPA